MRKHLQLNRQHQAACVSPCAARPLTTWINPSQTARIMLTAMAIPPAVVAMYLVKSALGINLLPGPSPLHELFYHFVR